MRRKWLKMAVTAMAMTFLISMAVPARADEYEEEVIDSFDTTCDFEDEMDDRSDEGNISGFTEEEIREFESWGRENMLSAVEEPVPEPQPKDDSSVNITEPTPYYIKGEPPKSWWFSYGKHTYYCLNGKICTKKMQKIGKYYYSFDSKGRRKTGLIRLNQRDYGYFSKKTGRFQRYLTEMRIVRVHGNRVVGRAQDGKLYSISIKDAKLVGKNGKLISKTRLKKNQRIQVSHKGNNKMASPGKILKVSKLKLL